MFNLLRYHRIVCFHLFSIKPYNILMRLVTAHLNYIISQALVGKPSQLQSQTIGRFFLPNHLEVKSFQSKLIAFGRHFLPRDFGRKFLPFRKQTYWMKNSSMFKWCIWQGIQSYSIMITWKGSLSNLYTMCAKS